MSANDASEIGQRAVEVNVEHMWRCSVNGRLYVSPRCSFGHPDHQPVTVTTTTTTEEVDG